MKNISSMLLIILFIITCQYTVNCMPAYPKTISFKQPDGTKLTIFLKGDEKLHWGETLDGYTLIFDNEGFLNYALLDNNKNLIPSGIKATEIQERDTKSAGLLLQTPKHLFYNNEQVSAMLQISDIQTKQSQRTFENGVLGNYKTLCILVNFQDKSMVHPKADFENLMNQSGYTTGGAMGSVKDFFEEASYGKMSVQVTIVGPYTAPKNSSYYAGYNGTQNCPELARWAIQQANATIDFNEYDSDNDGVIDGFHMLFAGHGQEASGNYSDIWSHKWNFNTLTLDGKTIDTYSCSPELRGSYGSDITYIGVICHEMTHAFGANDFYDIDYGGSGGEYPGTGQWDLMASGSWNGGGNIPAQINMYQKIKFKWVTPKELTKATTILNMPNADENPVAYKITTTTPGEYFILENRQKIKFDSELPGHGLLIYRIHKDIESSWDLNSSHPQKIYPVCATANTAIPNYSPSSYGNVNSSGCTFPGTGNKTSFTDQTIPSAKSWASLETRKPITNITENTTTKTINFDFMGGAPPAIPISITQTSGGNISIQNPSEDGTYETGTTITIIATADEGFNFSQWWDGTTVNPYQYTIDREITISGIFSEKKSIIISIDPNTLIQEYNGKRKDISYTTIPSNISCTINYEQNNKTTEPVNSGKYNITINRSEDNIYKKVQVTTELTIIKGNVTINKMPEATPLISGNPLSASSLNSGEASVEGTFEWTNPNLIPLETGDYEVKFIPKNGNYNETTFKINVIVKNMYSITIGECINGAVNIQNPSTDNMYEENTILELTANPNEKYKFIEWWDSDKNNPRSFTVKENTTITAVFDPLTNIDDIYKKEINVYTNNNNIYITNNETETINITIYNISGQCLKKVTSSEQKITITMTTPGIYTVIIFNNNTLSTFKVITK